MNTLKKNTWLMLLLLALSALTLAGCGGEEETEMPTVTVASKDFTEQFIVGEMFALMLENNGFDVERRMNLGATPVAHNAMLEGEIDIYPEYSGTGLLTVLQMEVMSDPVEVFNTVQQEYEEQFNLIWLEPAPLNNTQALAMTRERANELGIETFSDLFAQAGDLVLVGPPEFAEREDGIPGLREAYGDFEFQDFITVDPGLRYQALVNGEADVVVAFGTDGELAAYDLVLLEDDLNFYPPYQLAPVVRAEVLEANPNIESVLNQLLPLLDDSTMQRLNNEVSGEQREPDAVAREFLVEQDLIEE
jgi:osmoprotectant transport system substrate-binding protein